MPKNQYQGTTMSKKIFRRNVYLKLLLVVFALVGMLAMFANDSFAENEPFAENGYWARVNGIPGSFQIMFPTTHCGPWGNVCVTRNHWGIEFPGYGQGRNVMFQIWSDTPAANFNWQGAKMHQMVLDTTWSNGPGGRKNPSNYSAEMWFNSPNCRSTNCGSNVAKETSMLQKAEVSDPVPGLLSAYGAEQASYEIVDHLQYESDTGVYIVQHTYHFDSMEDANAIANLLMADSENGIVHTLFEDGEAVAMHTVQESGVMVLTQTSSMSTDDTLSALESAIDIEQIPTSVGLSLSTVSNQQTSMALLLITVVFLFGSITLKTSVARED